MELAQILTAVPRLAPEKRKRLTAWMVSEYPILSVRDLMARAQESVDRGEWSPAPPTADNFPGGPLLTHAMRTAEGLKLGKKES